jgi:hypothetical protein
MRYALWARSLSRDGLDIAPPAVQRFGFGAPVAEALRHFRKVAVPYLLPINTGAVRALLKGCGVALSEAGFDI